MLKQFHLDTKIFADPVLLVDENGEPILSKPPASAINAVQYTTSGEGWFALHTQEEIDGICATITGEGEVWAENGTIRYSGKRPSESHKWDSTRKKWISLTKAETQAKLTALLSQRKGELIGRLTEKVEQSKAHYLQGYSQAEIDSFYRQEREARNELPEMILTEILAGREDIKTMDELKAKVIEKADLFAIIMGATFARKQQLEHAIEEASTLEELDQLAQQIEAWQA